MKKKFLTLLKWSQKYTKTDMVYLANGGFWLTFTKIAGVIASLFSSIVFANLLSQHDYGIYQYVLAIVSLLTLTTLPGIDTALVRTVAKGNDNTFISSFKEKIKWGFLGTVLSFIISAYYFFNQNEVLGIAFLMVGFFIPFMDSLNIWIAFLSGKKDFKEQTKLQALTRTGSTIILILTVLFTRDPLIILLMYFISYTSFRFFIFRSVSKKIDANSPVDVESSKYGTHLTFLSMPTIFSKTLDSILIFQILGGPALAGYSLAKLPMKQFQNIFGSVNILALPKFSIRNRQELQTGIFRKIKLIYLIIIPILILYWVSAEFLFSLFYPQYLEYVFVSQIFTLQILSFPFSLIDTALTAHGEKKRMYQYALSTSIIRVILLVTFVPMYGVLGAVYAFVLTSFVSCSILFYMLKRFVHAPAE